MGYLIAADFEAGEPETRFDLFLTHAGDYVSAFQVFGLERLPPEFVEYLDSLDDDVRRSTQEIMKNPWFWTFSPECGWEFYHEAKRASVDIDWYLDSPEHLSAVESWMRDFGANEVTSHESDFDDMDEWC